MNMVHLNGNDYPLHADTSTDISRTLRAMNEYAQTQANIQLSTSICPTERACMLLKTNKWDIISMLRKIQETRIHRMIRFLLVSRLLVEASVAIKCNLNWLCIREMWVKYTRFTHALFIEYSKSTHWMTSDRNKSWNGNEYSPGDTDRQRDSVTISCDVLE